MTVIPNTAWEQAVYVSLFVAFVTGVLAWLTVQRKSDMEHADAQNRAWQDYLANSNAQWQEFNREQRMGNNVCMNAVNKSLQDLTSVTQALVQEVKEIRSDSRDFTIEFRDHDLQAKRTGIVVDKIPLNNPKAVVRPVPKPRIVPPKDND